MMPVPRLYLGQRQNPLVRCRSQPLVHRQVAPVPFCCLGRHAVTPRSWLRPATRCGLRRRHASASFLRHTVELSGCRSHALLGCHPRHGRAATARGAGEPPTVRLNAGRTLATMRRGPEPLLPQHSSLSSPLIGTCVCAATTTGRCERGRQPLPALPRTRACAGRGIRLCLAPLPSLSQLPAAPFRFRFLSPPRRLGSLAASVGPPLLPLWRRHADCFSCPRRRSGLCPRPSRRGLPCWLNAASAAASVSPRAGGQNGS